jgi:undecaprenyl-phosphate glucose phosphotransferase
MNNRPDMARRLAVQAGPQATLGAVSSSAVPSNARRVLLPDARPGPRGRARRMLDRPWTGLPATGRVAKRVMDIGVSAILLTLFSPLLAFVALAILLSSGRPIFYQQQRVGQGGRLFRMFKFRSMRNDAERETGPIWASDHDSRCTRIGDWLRLTYIDELPQLFNVLRGDMSLVGPRPERPIFVEEFRRTVPGYDLRHAVPGGMTGWAQVHGWRGRTSLRKRIQYDLDYIERWSIALDFRVLLMTFQHVLWGKTSWNDAKRPTRSEA